MKKIFYLSLTFLVLALIFLGAYNFAFKNNVNDPAADEEKKQEAKEEKKDSGFAPAESIENPINEEVLGAVAGEDGIYYYSLDEQSLKKVSFSGKNKEILMSNLPGVPTRVLWSPKRGKALLLLRQSNGQPLWHFADLSAKTLAPLKPEISHLAWNNLGDRIFYQYTDPGTGAQSLNTANPDGSNWKKLADLGTQDFFFASVPQSTAVSFWNRPNALEKTSFETVSIMGENRRTLLSDRFGADYLWSPDGENVLVSVSSQKGGGSIFLDVMNKNGGEYRGLSIPTLVSKAVWSKDGKTVYYALPGSLPATAVLPNDYYAKPLHTRDMFWKIDLQSGKKTRIVDLSEVTKSFDSADLFLSSDESALFFTDRVTRKLYRIEL